MATIQQIEENIFYKQILADSFGGVMYDVANRNKYDDGKQVLLNLWNDLTPSQQESAGGIMKGAISFLEGDE